MRCLPFACVLFVLAPAALAQPTQTVRGTVADRDTRAPLVGATVVVVGSDPLLGAATDAQGRFVLPRVPLGKHAVEVRLLGYAPRVLADVLVRAGQETVLDVSLAEAVVEGAEAVVRAQAQAGRPQHAMAAVSARSFSVEETRRYAGAVDDPARLAASFAGVATSGSGVQDNALAVRGNAPKGVRWRLEGVPIPTPSHFAGLSVAGGGGVTLFSGELLADSDVFTGAFPAEYGDALAGVFDMRFRTGHPTRREHAVRAGLLGLEVASEGPIRLGSPATYLVNYRYSTLGLLMPLLPTEGGTTYQDLAVKVSAPLGAGRVEAWGLGGLDGQQLVENPDSASWTSAFWDRTRADLALGVGAAGLTHAVTVGRRTYVRSTAAVTGQRTVWEQDRLGDDLRLRPELSLRSTDVRLHLGSTVDHKLRPGTFVQAGASVQRLGYALALRSAPDHAPPLVPVADGEGSALLTHAFAQARQTPTPGLDLTLGLHATHVALTGASAVEPRLGATWATSERTTWSAGYGLHSQLEPLPIVLARVDGGQPNRDLGLTRAHHVVLGASRQLGEAVRVHVEGYVQRLFDVPVVADSAFSLLDWRQDWAFAKPLVTEGAGENVGVEFTVERPLRGGAYALVTGSLFRSRARGGDGVWRPTRYDQRYAVNALAGRDVRLGDRHRLGLNVRLAALGGERRSPVDGAASAAAGEVVYNESRPFSERGPAVWVLDLTATLRVDGQRVSQLWSLQLKNALAAKDAALDYDLQRQAVVEVAEGYPLPVLSYQVEF
ncbi:carboxypeptidase regulatory-like domain-containing protein [Rubrivirga sp. IMCC45206]|uniref:TonB-dependent receptor n=1 Tax=Rubrivirga sp. IMCC45206 TaxID=3391614 RepID=UPI00399024C8